MPSCAVLAFDLYGTLVDPISIASELVQVLGDAGGREAASLWRSKQLEYSSRLTAMGRYEDFRWVTARALDFTRATPEARLPSGQAQRLVELDDHLQPFPDAVPALRALAGPGYELMVLSNGTPAMISNCLGNSGPGEFFGLRISVDEVRLFKPRSTVWEPPPPGCARPGSTALRPRSTRPARRRALRIDLLPVRSRAGPESIVTGGRRVRC
jgi:2-haloacid dehalogenase